MYISLIFAASKNLLYFFKQLIKICGDNNLDAKISETLYSKITYNDLEFKYDDISSIPFKSDSPKYSNILDFINLPDNSCSSFNEQ